MYRPATQLEIMWAPVVYMRIAPNAPKIWMIRDRRRWDQVPPKKRKKGKS